MHIRKGHHQKTNCVCVWHKTRRKRTFEKTDSWKELSWDHDLCVQCRVPFGNEDVNQSQAKTFSHLNKLCHNFHRLNVQPIFWLDFVIGTKEKRCEQFRARILYLSSQRGPSLFFLSTSTRSSRIFIRAKYKYIFCCFLFLSTLYNNKKKVFLKLLPLLQGCCFLCCILWRLILAYILVVFSLRSSSLLYLGSPDRGRSQPAAPANWMALDPLVLPQRVRAPVVIT